MDDFCMAVSESSKDHEIIDTVGQEHSRLIGVIQRRAGQIKTILNYWQSRNVSSAINAMNMMNDPCVIMDVLNSTFA